MIGRRQLAVASPVSPVALIRALRESLGPRVELEQRAARLIATTFGASSVVLTDSGTSALVLALRLAAKRAGRARATVGFPGYACVDLAAAARFAGVDVRLYDIDPSTLSPDLDSVERMFERGVDAVVVAHLFGYSANISGVRVLASARGVPVIEDAAQGAGGMLGDRRLGALGDLSLLSFGRGKGLCAGGGGALLSFRPEWSAQLESLALTPAGRGWVGLAKTAVQWALGRPSLYAVPAMIPWLHLGEMVYHPASEPTAMTPTSESLVAAALRLEARDLAARKRTASRLDDVAHSARDLGLVRPIPESAPGYLRFPVRDLTGRRRGRPDLGVTRPYPSAVDEQAAMRPVLASGEPSVPGATELARSLLTLPTHAFVTDSDIAAIQEWLAD